MMTMRKKKMMMMMMIMTMMMTMMTMMNRLTLTPARSRAAAVAAPTSASSTTKYVPPHLRNRDDGELDAIRKRMKRTLNTLSTTNIVSVSREVEQVFTSNSRNLATQALAAELHTLCCATDLTPNLAMAFGALLAATSTFVAIEVLSTVVEQQALRLDAEAERREVCNIVLLWACLFRLRSLSTATMCSTLSELAGRMDELSVELAMLIVRNCGSHLRRDDAAAFKAVVEAVVAKRDVGESSTRAKFLIDTIMELKDNRKQRADALDDMANATRKQLQTLFAERKATQPAALRATWRDLLDAQTKGRWWLVGSAWVGNVADAPVGGSGGVAESTARQIVSTQFSAELLAMARQQRMNTDLRRAIFCTMMDSEDFVDAHERLSRLGLRAKDQRELVHVLIHCATRERVFNPFYAHLADRFASTEKKPFLSALRFALWDKLRDLATASATATVNQAQLFAALVVAGCIKLSAFKVLNWALLDAPTLLFCRHFFRVLLADTPDTIERVFDSLKDKTVRVGIVQYLTGDFRLYMHRMLTAEGASDAALTASLNAARKHLKFTLDVIANSQIERDD
jgi:nucleolar MIF4G domain-containing protein 1